jgi:hypothetical protein
MMCNGSCWRLALRYKSLKMYVFGRNFLGFGNWSHIDFARPTNIKLHVAPENKPATKTVPMKPPILSRAYSGARWGA